MRSRAILVCTLLTSFTSACDSQDSAGVDDFESVSQLHAAMAEVDGFDCGPISPDFGEVNPALGEQFGMTELATCGDLVLHGFEDAEALDEFVETDRWVAFERIFRCVEDGDEFVAVAGENWMVESLLDPRQEIPGASNLISELDAEPVRSPPAVGTSGKCR